MTLVKFTYPNGQSGRFRLSPIMALGVTSSPYINEKVKFLSFSGGLIGETFFDFVDKTNKNIIVPRLTKELTDILVDFSIEWVRSLDPVRC